MGEQDKGNQQQREKDFVSHVPLMDEKVIEHMVVEKKKHDDLLSKYISEDLVEEQVEDKEILNI
jgi:pre-mRNA-splicing factor ISY1